MNADLIVAVGTKMGIGMATMNERLPVAGQKVVHVYPEASVIGRHFDVELGIVSDAGAFLESLAAQNAPELSDARKSWIEGVACRIYRFRGSAVSACGRWSGLRARHRCDENTCSG